MQLGQAFADFVRGMTQLDAHRLRDLIGDDDLQKFADLLGVDIEDRRQMEVDDDILEQANAAITENKKLKADMAKLHERILSLEKRLV